MLREQGVEVEVVRSIDDLEAARPDADTTVFVGDPTDLGPGATARLAAVAPGSPAGSCWSASSGEQLGGSGSRSQAFPGGGGDLVAGCDSDVARADDVVSAWDTRYVLTDDDAAGATLVLRAALGPDGPPGEPDPDGRLRRGHGRSSTPPRPTPRRSSPASARPGPTRTITDDSHAGTGGARARLHAAAGLVPARRPATSWPPGPAVSRAPDDLSVWPPGPARPSRCSRAAVVLLALARGRRLGRLVREPLPVVVRAIETTESRGRLYRRAGDRARAAAVLRSGTADRLARRLALGRGAGPAAAGARRAARATGRPARRGR